MMVAAVDPTVTAKVHERVRLAVNPHRLHFFDLGSEAAI
jgi:multiple sugar transport system ATP-binding protein